MEFPTRKMVPNQLRAWITQFLLDLGISDTVLSREAFGNPDQLRRFMNKSIRLEYKDDDKIIRAARRLAIVHRRKPDIQPVLDKAQKKLDDIRRGR